MLPPGFGTAAMVYSNLSTALASLTLVVLLGLYIATAPSWEDFRSFRASVNEHDSAITVLRLEMANEDEVQHPTLGTLKFPKSMPYDERNQIIDDLKAASGVKWDDEKPPNAPAGNGLSSPKGVRIVKMPDAAKEWMRNPWDFYKVHEFPGDSSDVEIMRAFETQVLLPRPTFSLATALRSHVWSLSVGLALFASGLFCCV